MDRGSRHCTGDRDQDYPQEKQMQKSNIAVGGTLANHCEKEKESKERATGKAAGL